MYSFNTKNVILFLMVCLIFTPPLKATHLYVDNTLVNSKDTVLKDNSCYIPLVVTNQLFNTNFSLNQKDKVIDYTAENLRVKLDLNSRLANINNVYLNLQAAPYIKNGTTYLPASVIARVLSLNVNYNNALDTLHFTTPNATNTQTYQRMLATSSKYSYGNMLEGFSFDMTLAYRERVELAMLKRAVVLKTKSGNLLFKVEALPKKDFKSTQDLINNKTWKIVGENANYFIKLTMGDNTHLDSDERELWDLSQVVLTTLKIFDTGY